MPAPGPSTRSNAGDREMASGVPRPFHRCRDRQVPGPHQALLPTVAVQPGSWSSMQGISTVSQGSLHPLYNSPLYPQQSRAWQLGSPVPSPIYCLKDEARLCVRPCCLQQSRAGKQFFVVRPFRC